MMHTRSSERSNELKGFEAEMGRLAFTKPKFTGEPGAREHNEMIRRAQEYFGD